MDATTETTSIEREIAIAASRETVWEFLVDPDKAILWMGERATFDLRAGGAWMVDVIPGHTASGAEENRVPPGSSTIEIELVPAGAGTTLRFTHRDLPGAETAASHAHGWDHYLERLAVAAAGGDAGRDPWLDGPM